MSAVTVSKPTAQSVIVKVAVALLATVAVLLALTGCSAGASKYAGTYTGSSGRTTLLLSSDGTAVYTQSHPGTHRSDDTGTAKWTLKDGVITVGKNDVLDYAITAKVDLNSTSLFFQAPGTSWNDEIYTKVQTAQ